MFARGSITGDQECFTLTVNQDTEVEFQEVLQIDLSVSGNITPPLLVIENKTREIRITDDDGWHN